MQKGSRRGKQRWLLLIHLQFDGHAVSQQHSRHDFDLHIGDIGTAFVPYAYSVPAVARHKSRRTRGQECEVLALPCFRLQRRTQALTKPLDYAESYLRTVVVIITNGS